MRITLPKYDIVGYSKREIVTVEFSKSGIKQQWRLYFNKGKLITDMVYTEYNKPEYLRTVRKCKTIEDVLNFLFEYSFHKSFVRIVTVVDMMEGNYNNKYKRIQDLIDFPLDVKKLNGTIYWGEYGIEFENGYITFNTTIPKKSLGTFEIHGKRDLINITIKIVGHISNELDYFKLLKKIEVL